MVDLDDHGAGQPMAVPAGYGGQRRLYIGRVAVAVVLDENGLDEGLLLQPVMALRGFPTSRA